MLAGYVMKFNSFSGSNNPEITLKIAEIRADSVGKVSPHYIVSLT